jgi:hypothetical protein
MKAEVKQVTLNLGAIVGMQLAAAMVHCFQMTETRIALELPPTEWPGS